MEKTFLIILINIFITFSCVAQVKTEKLPTKVFTVEELQKVDEITKLAETYFREGEINLKNKDVVLASKNFDSAVETILHSNLNMQEFEGLRNYYNSLVERIYKLEIVNPSLHLSESEQNKTNRPQVGFREQKFDPSSLDELATLETEKKSQKTTSIPIYTRPYPDKIIAKAGDTIEKIALRYGFNATELARYNGLLLNSSVPIGREIRFPPKDEKNVLGDKPAQAANGKVQIIMNWFQNNLHDPYSMKILRWSKVAKENFASEPFWVVRVCLRAKNTFGAYVLTEYVFLIRQNKIVRVVD